MKKYSNIIIVACVLLAGAACIYLRSQHAAAPEVAMSPAEAAFVEDVEAKARDIAGSYDKKGSIRAQANPVYWNIKHHEFAPATQALHDMLAKSKMHSWRFYPFDVFFNNLRSVASDDDYSAALTAWVQQEPKNAFAHLLRGKFLSDVAWAKRGTFTIDKTDSSQIDMFSQYSDDALAEIDEAIKLDPENRAAYDAKLGILLGEGDSAEMEAAFQQGIAKFPDYYVLYETRLQSLQPKWGGSLEKMYLFVRQYAATPNPAFKSLYFDLYDYAMDGVIFGPCHGIADVDAYHGCYVAGEDQVILPEVWAGMAETLGLYNHVENEFYNAQVRDEMNKIATLGSFDKRVAGITQMAAEKTGSDMQMVENNPGHNDFIIDLLTADVWRDQKNYNNALIKYQEALADLPRAPFAAEPERGIMAAHIMRLIAGNEMDASQYAEALPYDIAARHVDNYADHPHGICYDYYKLGYFATAIKECTRVIDDFGSTEARYWRGAIHKQLKNAAAAEKDFVAVADTDAVTETRASAAINAGIYIGQRKGYEAALDFYDKHPYMFDERVTSQQTLSITWNNRCYALMQLKQYQKALDNCNKSLTFGILPDAVNKRAQLMKLLAVPAKNL